MKADETAVCRGCGKPLDGKPYRYGGRAFNPDTREQCPVNFYGGYVCSFDCDRRASLDLERTMPGHSYNETTLSSQADQSLERNWK